MEERGAQNERTDDRMDGHDLKPGCRVQCHVCREHQLPSGANGPLDRGNGCQQIQWPHLEGSVQGDAKGYHHQGSYPRTTRRPISTLDSLPPFV